MNPDLIGAWLQEQGYEVRAHHLRKTAMQIGWRFVRRGCEVAWRCEGRRVWIIMVRRVEQRSGLGNPFSALYCLADAVAAVLGDGATLYGNVQVLSGSPLEGVRLGHFYRFWTGAQEPQPGWFELEAVQVQSLRQIRKQQMFDAP